MIMNVLFDLCTNSNVLTVFYILKIVFRIVCIIIPIIFMYRVFVPMFKTVISGKTISEHLPGIFKSFIAGLAIFLLPAILSFVFEDLFGERIPVTSCFTNAEVDIIKSYKQKEDDVYIIFSDCGVRREVHANVLFDTDIRNIVKLVSFEYL